MSALRAIVFVEDGVYVAQCLEHDIAAQGDGLTSVLERLDDVIEAEIAMRGPDLSAIGPALPYYHQLWDQRDMKLERVQKSVGEDFPEVEIAFKEAA